MTAHPRSLLRSAGLAGCIIASMALSAAAWAQSPSAGSQVQGGPARDVSRIISIGGDITEVLYALGAEGNILAVDATSQFPPEALKQKKSVGYMRALSTEGVLSLSGSLIIASDQSGPPEVVKALKSAPIPYVEITEDNTPAGVAQKVREIARVVGRETEGEALAARIDGEFATLAKRREAIQKPVRVLFVLNVVNGRVTVGGRHTSADAIMELAGAQNAAAMINGYKPVSDEAMLGLNPDVIVAMRRSSDHDSGALLKIKGLSNSPAVQNQRIYYMDGLYLLGFGPRAPRAALELMGRLYPDLAGQDAPAK